MMDKSLPSRISDLKDTVKLLNLTMAALRDVSEILEDMSIRIYSLEEDRRLLKENLRVCASKVTSLETRYSELLYRMSGR